MVQLIIWFSVYTGIFLLGMFMMKAGLYALSGHRLKQWLLRFTNTPLQGFLTGTIITALLQSSTAVMVITVGLVSTGYFTFRQSIGIILGSNIGSTITTEIMTLDLGDNVIPMLFIGAILVFFGHYRPAYSIGMIFVGLASLFFAMNGFSQLAKPLSTYPIVDEWLQKTNHSPFIGIMIGMILTAIIHSSAATIGISMGFLNEHILTLPAGIAILLGANIGTCVTGLLASIGSTYEAKLTAYTHLWFNVIGVVIFYFLIDPLAFAAVKLSSAPDVQLAHVSVLFNVICSVAALPFVRWIESAILFFHGKHT
ncbi:MULTISPECIES: Na/Pi symporter [unclassified Geobacillus]|uniref:Na/Pi symporter n=1 Tax=unclassified Geobacillus TaxID=2642459 RepID=UPI000BE46CBE|nr:MULTISPECIES: Na/Pi symporter [unclassified Geobacillus]PDM41380.1 Na/Pi cotransporter [Parageobacillus yumthangensis]RDV21781.1 Na/Pi cotransporter family protein [Parageobacillus toebii]TXK90250.1 Na/Pi cotransporter family protein [Parageobacillus sp. SY1]PUF89849.1 Na/Pi cotransporter family protein [Geobacillus sp. LYN3]TXK89237.1 Na/Pi cotransporter family protein [Geobacillus sp. AYS3]